jgi:aryl-alcohol dehydrogenase-like predicted oxidoreductase
MRYAPIPHTDLLPAVIALGTNRFGTAIAARDAFALLDAYVDLGGNFIDTAHIYADWLPGATHSASEKTIGAWLRARGRRDRLVLATKGAHPELATPHISRLSPAEIGADVRESLEFLQTDHVDLYWLHRDDPAVPVADILGALEELVHAGLIRYYGCSNWRPPRIRSALDHAVAGGLTGFVANQPQWSLAAPNRAALSDPERLVVLDAEGLELHRETGLALVPWSSQGQGIFDKLARLGVEGLNEKDRLAYVNDVNLRRLARVQALSEEQGASISAIALSYLTSQPFPTYPIVGCRTTSQLAESVQAVEVTLTTAELAFLAGD